MPTTPYSTRRTRTASPSRRSASEVSRAQSPDDVDRLETAWRALDARGSCPSSHFGWTRACLSAFSDEATIEIIAVHRGGELSAVAPLIRKRRHGVHRLLLAGAGELGEPTDFAWHEQGALRRLAATVARNNCPLWLARIGADSPVLDALRRAYRGRALMVVRPDAPYPYIQLDESWLEPEQHLNAYCRSMLQTARRRAEQLGPVAIEIHTPNLHELAELLDAAFQLAASEPMGQSSDASAGDLHRSVFDRQYAEAACVAGTLRICFLRFGDRIAAAQVAIESGGGFWLLMAGEDPRFDACAPSQLLARETIRYAAEANLDAYEFWGRPASWTQIWTNRMRGCVSLRAYPFGMRGCAALVADAVAAGWRKLRNP